MSDNPKHLLNCPFCAAEAAYEPDHTVEENHSVGCANCGIWFDTFNSDDADAAWNTRTAPQVKPLVWEKGGDRASDWVAKTPFGDFVIHENAGDRLSVDCINYLAVCDDLERAKEIGDSYYQQRQRALER